ncbi:hypothetical protein NC652_041398 [Populus alba x Populus x berolinensis]|nr:hypothetical protein NC652_041398 [Populus alba x Populus x berolinensis]
MIVLCYATDDVVCDAFNTWFLSCHSLLDKVGDAQCLENTIKDDGVVYHAR